MPLNEARGAGELEVTQCGSGATANFSRGFRPLGGSNSPEAEEVWKGHTDYLSSVGSRVGNLI